MAARMLVASAAIIPRHNKTRLGVKLTDFAWQKFAYIKMKKSQFTPAATSRQATKPVGDIGPGGRSKNHSNKVVAKKKTQSNLNLSDDESIGDYDVIDDPLAAELLTTLSRMLVECSRQKLRAMEMMFRRRGNSISETISANDLKASFEEFEIRLPSNSFNDMVKLCQIEGGLDIRRICRLIGHAHSGTGRDSVRALYSSNGETMAHSKASNNREHDRPKGGASEAEEDLLQRITEQFLLLGVSDFATDSLLRELKQLDSDKSGRVLRLKLSTKLDEYLCPVYGAVLNALLKKCVDEEHPDAIRYNDFIDYIRKAQSRLPPPDEMKIKYPRKLSVSRVQGPANATPNIEVSEGAVRLLKERWLEPARRNSQAHAQATLAHVQKLKLLEKLPEERTDNPKDQAAESGQRVEAQTGATINSGGKNEPSPRDGAAQTHSGSSNAQVAKKTDTSTGKTNANSKQTNNKATRQPTAARSRSLQNSDTNRKAASAKPKKNVSAVETEMPAEKVSTVSKTNLLPIPADCRGASASSTNAPNRRLQLDWTYGYRGSDVRKNLLVLKSGELLYFTAHVAVIYDSGEHRQRHYTEHSDDIKMITLHGDKQTVATAQTLSPNGSEKSQIRIWNSDNLQTLYVLNEDVFGPNSQLFGVIFNSHTDSTAARGADGDSNSVRAVDRLVLVASSVTDGRQEHQLLLINYKKSKVLADAKLDTTLVCDFDCNPKDRNVFVIGGHEYLTWWQFEESTSQLEIKQEADYEKNLRAEHVTLVMHNGFGDLITGDSNGTVYIFRFGSNRVTNYVSHAHRGPVYSACLHKGVLFTGGKDTLIYAWRWSKNMERLGSLLLPEIEKGTRQLLVYHSTDAEEGPQLVAGTLSNSLLLVALDNAPESEQQTEQRAKSAKRRPMSSVSRKSAPRDAERESSDEDERANPQPNPFANAQISKLAVTHGHMDQLCAVTRVPSHPTQFLTAGYDGKLCIHDSILHRCLQQLKFAGKQISCLTWTNEDVIAFGTRDGWFTIMQQINETDVNLIYSSKVCNKGLTYVASPDGMDYFVLGTTDGGLIVIVRDYEQPTPSNVKRNAKQPTQPAQPVWRPAAHSRLLNKPIAAIDFAATRPSNGETIIRVAPLQLEACIIFLLAPSLTPIVDESRLTDIVWATCNVTYSYETHALRMSRIFTSQPDLLVSTVDAHRDPTDMEDAVLAIGDFSGRIILYRYPCATPDAFCHITKTVPNLRRLLFVAHGHKLIAVGGRDACVMQYSLL